MKLNSRKNHFATQQHKKITTYYNIYKTERFENRLKNLQIAIQWQKQ